jgi:proteic killer suppression protein
MIRSFRDNKTQRLFEDGEADRRWRSFKRVAERKLAMLNAAATLTDLRVPPHNYLEALKKDRKGQHSIRINDQWRICFLWTDEGPEEVEIVDYH